MNYVPRQYIYPEKPPASELPPSLGDQLRQRAAEARAGMPAIRTQLDARVSAGDHYGLIEKWSDRKLRKAREKAGLLPVKPAAPEIGSPEWYERRRAEDKRYGAKKVARRTASKRAAREAQAIEPAVGITAIMAAVEQPDGIERGRQGGLAYGSDAWVARRAEEKVRARHRRQAAVTVGESPEVAVCTDTAPAPQPPRDGRWTVPRDAKHARQLEAQRARHARYRAEDKADRVANGWTDSRKDPRPGRRVAPRDAAHARELEQSRAYESRRSAARDRLKAEPIECLAGLDNHPTDAAPAPQPPQAAQDISPANKTPTPARSGWVPRLRGRLAMRGKLPTDARPMYGPKPPKPFRYTKRPRWK